MVSTSTISSDSENAYSDIFTSSDDVVLLDSTSKPKIRRRRPSFQAGAPFRRSRVRYVRSDGDLHGSYIGNGDLNQTDFTAGLTVTRMRGYITSCTEDMVEDMERMYVKMSTVADKGAQMVHRTAMGGVDIMAEAATKSGEMAKSAMRKVKHWNHLSYAKLPNWMKDNEFLQFGHRPELNSFRECFKSIFGIHSETGNIWTHLIGFVIFVAYAILFYLKPLCENCQTDLDLKEKLIFLFFFLGATLCLGLSSLFHTVCCHSEHISKLFVKFDYVGISLLTIGSFIPWIYYGFYCHFTAKVVYLSTICVLGVLTIIVSLMDSFASKSFRPIRAILFVCLGGFGFVPSCHFLIMSGWEAAQVEFSIHKVLLMGALYILGAVIYGSRIPERFLPGKCDIWFHSHQIFHVLVIAAAFVHFHGMQNMAVYRLTKAGACDLYLSVSNSSTVDLFQISLTVV